MTVFALLGATALCGLPEDEFYADSFTTQADLASDELR